jgi:glycerol-3-phosphate acyltransferase PlsY
MPVGLPLLIAAYLIGSVSFGLVLAARRGVDLRAVGSGNTGATNVARALGKRAGHAVMALDALKGFLPALGARLWLGPGDPWTAAAAVATALGHVLPIWHRFRGGKGAATAAGAMLAVLPPAGLAALVAFFGLKKLTRRASVGSLGGAMVGALVALALGPGPWPVAMAVALLALVVLRHWDNLGRLLRGQEPPS